MMEEVRVLRGVSLVTSWNFTSVAVGIALLRPDKQLGGLSPRVWRGASDSGLRTRARVVSVVAIQWRQLVARDMPSKTAFLPPRCVDDVDE
jgi:hypothetical protein